MADYKVKSGDTLYALAKEHGTTADALMKANGISDARKLRAGSTIQIPGQSTSGSSGYSSSGSTSSGSSSGGSSKRAVTTSGHTTYGNGAYGGKYVGSNNSNLYQNMENAPGSTGYERGTATWRWKDEDGNEYSDTREGVLPLGTSFKATGAALADRENSPDSSGIFAYARGRTPGYLEHVSGYKGYGYQDAKGNFYDANGNYLREDGYFYDPGASVSKNGMYQDTGNGYGHAGYSVVGNGKTGVMYTKGPNYGVAPNSVIYDFWDWGGGGGSRPSLPTPTPSAPPAKDPVAEEIEEILGGRTYMNNYSQHNDAADYLEKVYADLQDKNNRNYRYRNY